METTKKTGTSKNGTLTKIVGLWNGYAPHYRAFSNLRWLYGGFRRKMKKALIPCENGVVLDGGCGPGPNFETIIEALKPRLLIGLDFSKEMLKEAEKVRAGLNGRNDCEIKLVEADLDQRFPFPDNHFDAQIYHLVLYYLPYGGWKRAIPETFRVAKPGGYVVTTDFLEGYTFRKTVGGGWRPVALALMEILRFPTYIHFMKKVRPILLKIQELEEEGILEFPSKEELITAFEKAGFERIEIISQLMGGGIVLRAFKPR